MSGAASIVATRSLALGSVRVAMIPGIAQAKEDSSATKARPSSPARLMIRSMRKAARDMYPTPSRKAMMRNMMMIWGTKVSTAPTPPMRPSPRSPASSGWDSSSQPCTSCPRAPKPPSTASWKGAAQVKIAWKKMYMMAKNTRDPRTGLSRTLSTAVVMRSCWGAW